MASPRISVRIPPTLYQRIEDYRTRSGISQSEAVVAAGVKRAKGIAIYFGADNHWTLDKI